MKIEKNVSLIQHSTMRLGGEAKFAVEVSSPEDIQKAAEWAKENIAQIMMIGQGSNIVWTASGFDGLLLINRLGGFEILPNEDEFIIKIGAGEVWDEAVERTVNEGLSGIEQLSLIPGTAGATPVQNVGAYGRELSEVFVSLDAFDVQENKFITLENKDCNFSYRKSRFNTTDRNRFLITSITLRLKKTNPEQPFYGTLEKYFAENKISDYTPEIVRKAVIDIRNSKLPDPKIVANCGSFFANPIVETDKKEELLIKYPEMPSWKMTDGSYKISAAWMLDQLGLKGYKDTETGMALWKNQPLVFVNENAKSTDDLLKFKQKIIDLVEDKFGVVLKQEPELI